MDSGAGRSRSQVNCVRMRGIVGRGQNEESRITLSKPWKRAPRLERGCHRQAGLSPSIPSAQNSRVPLPVARRSYSRFASGFSWHRVDNTELWRGTTRRRFLPPLTRRTNKGGRAGFCDFGAQEHRIPPCATQDRFEHHFLFPKQRRSSYQTIRP